MYLKVFYDETKIMKKHTNKTTIKFKASLKVLFNEVIHKKEKNMKQNCNIYITTTLGVNREQSGNIGDMVYSENEQVWYTVNVYLDLSPSEYITKHLTQQLPFSSGFFWASFFNSAKIKFITTWKEKGKKLKQKKQTQDRKGRIHIIKKKIQISLVF